MTGNTLHSARWNRQGLLVKNRRLGFLSTVYLSAQGGRRRLFLYTLRPDAEFAPNSPYTASTGPTATPADQINQFSNQVVGTRSEG